MDLNAHSLNSVHLMLCHLLLSHSSLSVTPTTGVSLTEHCMKKLHELRELQELLEQNILPQQEFMEQKKLVLDCLRKLTRLATVCMVISTYIHT